MAHAAWGRYLRDVVVHNLIPLGLVITYHLPARTSGPKPQAFPPQGRPSPMHPAQPPCRSRHHHAARWRRLKRSARFPFVGRSWTHVAKGHGGRERLQRLHEPFPSQQPSRAAGEEPTPLTPRTTLALQPPLILRPGHRCQHAASAWVRPWRCLRRRPPPPQTPAGAALPRRHRRRRRHRHRRRRRRRRRPPASAPGTSLQSVRSRGKKTLSGHAHVWACGRVGA
jgi:hypothetical protein